MPAGGRAIFHPVSSGAAGTASIGTTPPAASWARLQSGISRSCVRISAGAQSARMAAAPSALSAGLTGTATAPALRMANSAIAGSAPLSISTATRSPRWTPRPNRLTARLSEAASSSP